METTVRQGSLPLAFLLLTALFGSFNTASLPSETAEGVVDWQWLLSLGEAFQEAEAPSEGESTEPPPWTFAAGLESAALAPPCPAKGYRVLAPARSRDFSEGSPRAPPLLR